MEISLLLADGIDQIIGIVFLIIAGLTQLFSNRKPKPKPQRPVRVPRPQAGQPGQPGNVPAAGAAGAGQDKLRREVEDFLRRARGEAPAADEQGAARQRELSGDRSGAQRRHEVQKEGKPKQSPRNSPRRQAQQRPQPQRQPVNEPRLRMEPIEESDITHGDTVAEHVATHMDSAHDTAERVSHLGEEVGYADERLEEHLRHKFDHKIGTLEQRSASVEVETRSDVAAEVIDMLMQPGGMQRVIIANEILKRPDF
ncbi:hypothetical protein [Adhaeretor mobilis]|uniref:Uncharacterized protein n=1 Tax=Adhaeretor mobilis TaxID=1930276 RepID=A0A517MRW8_9BACT|nr:hypothetical protein [Adhaeretor mobilis]QDS97629.1 hypothetical protein HG15A2_08930 [Adhaeretor mobilis]